MHCKRLGSSESVRFASRAFACWSGSARVTSWYLQYASIREDDTLQLVIDREKARHVVRTATSCAKNPMQRGGRVSASKVLLPP